MLLPEYDDVSHEEERSLKASLHRDFIQSLSRSACLIICSSSQHSPSMMGTTILAPSLIISCEQLTPESFAPFGTLTQNLYPEISRSNGRSLPPGAIIANQGTAIKYSNVLHLTNRYSHSEVTKDGVAHLPTFSLFSCVPAPLTDVGQIGGPSRPKSDHVFEVKVMERHPLTSQTFIPLGLSPDEVDSKYLIIVARTAEPPRTVSSSLKNLVAGTSPRREGPPDLPTMRAFLAHGDQVVTYAAGTWHSPMVVLGQKRVNFLVSQYMNNVPGCDCQEVTIAPERGVGHVPLIEMPSSILTCDIERTMGQKSVSTSRPKARM